MSKTRESITAANRHGDFETFKVGDTVLVEDIDGMTKGKVIRILHDELQLVIKCVSYGDTFFADAFDCEVVSE